MATTPPYVDPRDFMYLVVPWVRTVPIFTRYTPYTIYGLIEGFFKIQMIAADIVHLIDGTTVYRVSKQYMPWIKHDIKGPYITLSGNRKLYFVDNDPSWIIKPINGKKTWTSI